MMKKAVNIFTICFTLLKFYMTNGYYAHKFIGFSFRNEIPHFAASGGFIRNDNFFFKGRGVIRGDLPGQIAPDHPSLLDVCNALSFRTLVRNLPSPFCSIKSWFSDWGLLKK